MPEPTAADFLDPTTPTAGEASSLARAFVVGLAHGDVNGACQMLAQIIDEGDPILSTNFTLALAGIPIAMAEWFAVHADVTPNDLLRCVLAVQDDANHTWPLPPLKEGR